MKPVVFCLSLPPRALAGYRVNSLTRVVGFPTRTCGKAEQFEQRFQTRARLVDGMPRFIWNKVLCPVNPGDPYIVLTLWESRAS